MAWLRQPFCGKAGAGPAALLIAWLALMAAALVTGCSTHTKRFWLNVFFEGVDKTNRVAAASTRLARGATNSAPVRATTSAEPVRFIHQAYLDQKCSGCHASTFSQKLRPDLGEACLSCHKSLLPAGAFWHAPAASGDCILCHEPHESARKFLLKEPPKLLCAQCHEGDTMAAHKAKTQADCTTCHNPHQSSRPFFLRVGDAPAGAAADSERLPIGHTNDNHLLLDPGNAFNDISAIPANTRPTSAALGE